MGKHARKTPYKKLLKEEKAKTKLKISHKTVLPKGQNITNTTFKVKKIIVKSQLKEHQGEIVSKSNLNVKDLLSRLHHHNAPLRVSSLASLSEVIDTHGNAVLNTYLSALLHTASNLILDKDQDVRMEAIKLLSVILGKTSAEQLSELFEIIVKHLACAMSHIDTNIRSSSLAMLDVLIAKHPKLTAKHCQPVILPAFLDLISTKYADSERKLILQYSDKMTTNMWRIKVLIRLQALLNAIVTVRKEENSVQEEQEYVERMKWENDKPLNASLYHCPFDSSRILDLSRLQSSKDSSKFDQNNEIKNYTELLIPLLLDIFVEVAPQKSRNQKTAQLSNEAAVLLKFISSVILQLWQIFESCDSSTYLKFVRMNSPGHLSVGLFNVLNFEIVVEFLIDFFKNILDEKLVYHSKAATSATLMLPFFSSALKKNWFSNEFGKTILDRMISGRFPYILQEHNRASAITGKKNKNVTLPGNWAEHSKFLSDTRCIYLNVTLSHVCLLLCKYSRGHRELKTVLQYVTNVLPSCLQMDRESIIQMLNCADSLFALDWKEDNMKFDTAHLIGVIKQLYHDSSSKSNAHHNLVNEKTFNYLYKIVSSEKSNASNSTELTSWLDSLPYLLTKKKVSFHMVKCIANVARCNIPAFSNSLDGYIESILNNLPHLEIITDRKIDRSEGKKLIANLLYFVQTWDEEFISGLKEALNSGYFAHLNNYVRDIMECKLSLY